MAFDAVSYAANTSVAAGAQGFEDGVASETRRRIDGLVQRRHERASTLGVLALAGVASGITPSAPASWCPALARELARDAGSTREALTLLGTPASLVRPGEILDEALA